MDDKIVKEKASAEGLNVASVQQSANAVLIYLAAPAAENDIRNFKTQLRMMNPNIARIEVRQPPGQRPDKPQNYVRWRNTMLQKLDQLAASSGWEFYTDPTAGKNTEHFLLMRGQGNQKQIIRVRVSKHPRGDDVSDVSFDMTGKDDPIDRLIPMLSRTS